jgi:hypothetical protein
MIVIPDRRRKPPAASIADDASIAVGDVPIDPQRVRVTACSR